jgi:hypothetical protein
MRRPINCVFRKRSASKPSWEELTDSGGHRKTHPLDSSASEDLGTYHELLVILEK